MSTRFTRCPQCRTTFRVTPQQLALREGQVRCGHCRNVFNAFSALVNFKGERVPGPGMESVQHETMTLRDSVAAPESAFTVAPRPGKPVASVSLPLETETADHTSPSLHTITHTHEKNFSPPQEENLAVKEDGEAAGREIPHHKKRWRKNKPSPLALVLDPAEKPTLWQRLHLPAWCRPLFYLISLPGLSALLAAQATFFLHDELASRHPELTPVLTQGCRWLGCEIKPLQNLDALTIEASDLQSDPHDAQQLLLTVTLRNRSNRPVAYPSLSLELTDEQGKLQARRSFAPEMYVVRATDVDAGAPAARDQVLRLLLRSRLAATSGYRLSLVYF